MSAISTEVGKNIHTFRKKQGLTLEALSTRIHKSKSTVSKYEKGEIVFDIEVLYEIAVALDVHVEQLLCCPTTQSHMHIQENVPAFFKGISQFYGYIFDGRNSSLIRCVFDILSEAYEGQYKIVMYMNFEDYAYYQKAENTYWGYMEHYDALTTIQVTNQDMPMEKGSVNILSTQLNYDTKWGLWTGFSSRPMMPIATKILLSKTPLEENKKLIESLKINKEDIRMMKLYNMYPVL